MASLSSTAQSNLKSFLVNALQLNTDKSCLAVEQSLSKGVIEKALGEMREFLIETRPIRKGYKQVVQEKPAIRELQLWARLDEHLAALDALESNQEAGFDVMFTCAGSVNLEDAAAISQKCDAPTIARPSLRLQLASRPTRLRD